MKAYPPLEEAVRPTRYIDAPALKARLGLDVIIASEAGQHTGSFKFRAAYNVASTVSEELIITASSGNFGQALAYACRLLGKRAIVVMPDNSARVKVEAVRAYGGAVEFVNTREKSRSARVAELAAEHPEAYVASSYDDPLVIAGNASLGRELAASPYGFEVVVPPVGGGGLSAGVVLGLGERGSAIAVVGAEPAIANDAARSLRTGSVIAHADEPQTIADGARTVSLGRHNWAILQTGLAGIVEVSEAQIVEAMRLLRDLAGLRVEPTGAVATAALLAEPERFAGKRIAAIVSGGNVDPEVYDRLVSQEWPPFAGDRRLDD